MALAASSSAATGLPTRSERPTTTASAPSSATSWRRSSSITPAGVHGRRPGRPLASSPAEIGVSPSTSLAGSISSRQRGAVDLRRRRELEQDARDRGVVVEARAAAARPPRGRRRAGSRWSKPSMPTSARGLLLAADVDRRGRVVADEHGRQAGRRGCPASTHAATSARTSVADRLRDRLAVDDLGRHCGRAGYRARAGAPRRSAPAIAAQAAGTARWSLGRVGEPRAARRAGRLAERPGDVDERERDRLLDAVALGAVGRASRSPATTGSRSPARRARSARASCQAASGHGSSAITTAAAARPASAGARRPRRSEIRPDDRARRSPPAPRRPGSSRRSPPRRRRARPAAAGASTLSVPNSSPGRHHQPHAERARCGRAPPRPASPAAAAAPARGGRAQRPGHQPDARPRRPPENTASGPSRGGERAEHRPEQRADDRGAHRGADQLAAPLARRLADQPAERARPRHRAADALDEARGVEHDDARRRTRTRRSRRP